MPLPDYSALNADPASMLTYMKSNLILTDKLANSKLHNVPEYLELIPAYKFGASGPAWEGTDGTKDVDVYSLVASDKTSKAEALHSYICDYKKNEYHYATLAKAANFCFTVTMNGCTFGIGTPTGDGTVIVSHCNRAEAGKEQRPEQQAITLERHGKDGEGKYKVSTMLNPGVYRVADRMSATTFGLLVGGSWKFYFQSWRTNNGKMETFGAMEVPLNQHNT